MANHPNRSKRKQHPCANPTAALIIARRQSAGLTQAASAQLVCATERGWQHYEAGERRMHPSMWRLYLMLTDDLVAANVPPPPLNPTSAPAAPTPTQSGAS